MSPAQKRQLRSLLSNIETDIEDLIDEVEKAAQDEGYAAGHSEGVQEASESGV